MKRNLQTELTTADDPSAGQGDGVSDRLEDIGDPKVGNLEDAARAVNQNILWLEIAMLFFVFGHTINTKNVS